MPEKQWKSYTPRCKRTYSYKQVCDLADAIFHAIPPKRKARLHNFDFVRSCPGLLSVEDPHREDVSFKDLTMEGNWQIFHAILFNYPDKPLSLLFLADVCEVLDASFMGGVLGEVLSDDFAKAEAFLLKAGIGKIRASKANWAQSQTNDKLDMMKRMVQNVKVRKTHEATLPECF